MRIRRQKQALMMMVVVSVSVLFRQMAIPREPFHGGLHVRETAGKMKPNHDTTTNNVKALHIYHEHKQCLLRSNDAARNPPRARRGCWPLPYGPLATQTTRHGSDNGIVGLLLAKLGAVLVLGRRRKQLVAVPVLGRQRKHLADANHPRIMKIQLNASDVLDDVGDEGIDDAVAARNRDDPRLKHRPLLHHGARTAPAMFTGIMFPKDTK